VSAFIDKPLSDVKVDPYCPGRVIFDFGGTLAHADFVSGDSIVAVVKQLRDFADLIENKSKEGTGY
jgi:hypothetical protein